MEPTALLFSGQGAQRVGMGSDLATASPAAHALLHLAPESLPADFLAVLQNGPEESLTRTSYCQPALYLHGLALWQILRERRPDFIPTATAGLSLGEFTAHAAAGTFSAIDGLRLVARRGTLMEEACAQNQGAMLALLGTTESIATQIASTSGWEVANLNGGGQVVLSGPAETLVPTQTAAQSAGVKRSIPLKVAGAYHSSLMQSARTGLALALQNTKILPPTMPVSANFLGRPASSESEIRSSLLDQVTGTVRWEACLRQLADSGIRHFLELGPGGVLTALAKKTLPDLPCTSAGTLAELEKVIHELPANSRTALITGASRGLGRAIALRLAQEGWSVALVARQVDKLNEVRQTILTAGGHASVHPADISDPSAALQVITAVEKESGAPLGALINNAGITKDGLVMRMSDEDWSAVLETNLTGAFRWIRAASRGMLKARAGRIVNIGSVVGLVGNAGQANYAAAKAGLIGLTQSVAREFASRGITCNCVCPGFFETDMTSVLSDELKSKVLANIPLARLGDPKEIAGLVSFLCGPDAGYVTGQAWAMDGGMTM